MDDNIYAIHPVGWALYWGIYWVPRKLKCNSSSHKLSTPSSQWCMCKKIYVKNSFTNAENDDGSMVRYLTDVKSARFWSQLEASWVSSCTEEFWYNETVYLWMTIYAYIYCRHTFLKMTDKDLVLSFLLAFLCYQMKCPNKIKAV